MVEYAVSGFASTPHIDMVRDVVPPSAFADSLRAKPLSGPKGIKFLWYHEYRKPLGRITKLEIRNGGLWIEAVVETDISWGADAVAAIKSNDGFSFSIGYRVVDASIITAPDGMEALQLDKVDLREVSVVVAPANEEAIMTAHGKRDPLADAQAAVARLNAVFDNSAPRLEDTLAQMKRIFA